MLSIFSCTWWTICMFSHFLVQLFVLLAIGLYKFFIYLDIFSCQICKYSLSLSTFCGWFALLCKSSLVWNNPTCWFVLLLPLLLCQVQKIKTTTLMSWSLAPLFTSRTCGFRPSIQVFIPFESVSWVAEDSVSFLLRWLSSFPNTTCWRDR